MSHSMNPSEWYFTPQVLMTSHDKIQYNDTYNNTTMAISNYKTKYDAHHSSSIPTQYSHTVPNTKVPNRSSREHLCA